MLLLLRRHLRTTTVLLLGVLVLSWVGSVSAQHHPQGTAGPPAMAMPGMADMERMVDDPSGTPCDMNTATLDRDGCARCSSVCCVSLPEFAHSSHATGPQIPDWEKSAVLFSATPVLPVRAVALAPPSRTPPGPVLRPPLDRPFDNFRILLI